MNYLLVASAAGDYEARAFYGIFSAKTNDEAIQHAATVALDLDLEDVEDAFNEDMSAEESLEEINDGDDHPLLMYIMNLTKKEMIYTAEGCDYTVDE